MSTRYFIDDDYGAIVNSIETCFLRDSTSLTTTMGRTLVRFKGFYFIDDDYGAIVNSIETCFLRDST